MRAQDHRPGPHLTVSDTNEAIAFYTDVFDAVAIERECLLDGRVLHAELAVGGHRLTVSEWYEAGVQSAAEGRDDVLTIERTDPESVLRRAVAAGARVEPPADPSRQVTLRDPAGLCWAIVGPQLAA
ncbi:glyoxalase [Micromonospora sp. C31]|uniref:VOC family protein n=1 Tax=Micromonospora sp. C31 TaxID=2824876 RepID=UPI001B38848E|nr:VOC family protein [Micromonospora sp. C31]MBQ1073115.1 glyoxalase [Micromonospora sp. C31]